MHVISTQGKKQASLTGSTWADVNEIPLWAAANLLLPSGAVTSNTEAPAPSFDYLSVRQSSVLLWMSASTKFN